MVDANRVRKGFWLAKQHLEWSCSHHLGGGWPRSQLRFCSPEGAPGPSLLGTGDVEAGGWEWRIHSGGPGLSSDCVHSRVPPVPRFWGPGMLREGAGNGASTRVIASLSVARSIAIRSPRVRERRSDSGGSLTTSNPQVWPSTPGGLGFDGCSAVFPRTSDARKR